MTNIILRLDQRDIDPSVSTENRDNYKTRYAARAVVLDEMGAVALLHARVHGYYKLPGGGIDDGEDVAQALAREIMEEIGSVAEVTDELGVAEEWRDDDELHQVSHCYKAQLKGAKGTPTFTDKEIKEGFEVVWAPNIEAATGLVEAATDSTELRVKFMTMRDAAILRAAKLLGVDNLE